MVEIPRGSWHDWWNASDDEEAVARVFVSDGTRFVLMIENLFGLARDGHTNGKGMPDPLQLTMFATEFRDVLVFKRPPAAIQSLALRGAAPDREGAGLPRHLPAVRSVAAQNERSVIRS